MRREPTAKALLWRGPFRVERDGRTKWRIVNRYGDPERLGHRYKGAADEEARLMNLAATFCDEVDE
jgi:hypothetical protein